MIMWNGVITGVVIFAAIVCSIMFVEYAAVCVIVAAVAGGYIGHITEFKDN